MNAARQAGTSTMTKLIVHSFSGFDATGRAVLTIPNGAESVGLRFYGTTEINPDPTRTNAQVGVVLVVEDPPTLPGTHTRTFMLVPDGTALPANFIKYVGSFPHGPDKILTHTIEVSS